MKTRSSTRIVIGSALVLGISYGGYRVVLDRAIAGAHFDPVVPKAVNLLGIDTGSGYRIIVANQMAQLVQRSDNFGGNESGSEGATEGSIKKRIPMKEMLAVLRGDETALGSFTMTMNEMKEQDLPPTQVIWTAADIKKAIAGDPVLKKKLEDDLNVGLDGMPLSQVRPSSIENGIVVKSPVQVTVNLGGTLKTVVGQVLEPYKPRFILAVEKNYADKNYTRDMQRGYYVQEAKDVMARPEKREIVKDSLLDLVSDATAKRRAEPVERILKSATVVINDSQIEKASFRTYDTPDGKRSDLTIDLTDEGRKRLWKYSRDKVGTQLLLVADGVAIEAPHISHVLAEGELTITQMRDQSLVKDATEMINKHTAKLD